MSKILYLGTSLEYYSVQDPSRVIHCPLIRCQPKELPGDVLKSFTQATHLLFTSKNCVRLFFEMVRAKNLHAFILQKKIISIGPSTSAQLVKEGFPPAYQAKIATQEGVIALLEGFDLQSAYILFPHSSLSRTLIKDFLTEKRAGFKSWIFYETLFLNPREAVNFEGICEIVFTSPSTVRAFLVAFGVIPKDKRLSCIGEVTKKALSQALLQEERDNA